MHNDKKQLNEELFKAIVINRDNKNFKVVSGDYKDKKDLSDHYINDYIIRKVYKKEVFEWILRNAKNTLDAYILLSTSYRKWVNKDITKDYYYKIRRDLPILTYEESKMEKFVKKLIKETIDNVNMDDVNIDDLIYDDSPYNASVTLFVKGPLGNKIDKKQVVFPLVYPEDKEVLDKDHVSEEEIMYSNEDVEKAVSELRQKYPNKSIYYQLNGGKPQEYLEF